MVTSLVTKVGSVTKFGYFWQILASRFFKISPNNWQLLGLFWKSFIFTQKLLLLLFGNFWIKFWLLLNSTSGHTDGGQKLLHAEKGKKGEYSLELFVEMLTRLDVERYWKDCLQLLFLLLLILILFTKFFLLTIVHVCCFEFIAASSQSFN